MTRCLRRIHDGLAYGRGVPDMKSYAVLCWRPPVQEAFPAASTACSSRTALSTSTRHTVPGVARCRPHRVSTGKRRASGSLSRGRITGPFRRAIP